MNYFNLTTSGSPMPLTAVLGSANQDTSRNVIVFVVIVSLVGIGWLLAMAGLAGGWRRLLPKTREMTIVPFAGIALLAIVALSFLVLRGRVGRQFVRPKASELKLAPEPAAKLPPASANAPALKSPRQLPHSAELSSHSSGTPTSDRSGERPTTSFTDLPEANTAAAETPREAKPVQQVAVSLVLSPKKTGFAVHGANALSDPQIKRVCGAVSPFAGAQVYIKWSPGANAEQFASQLSKAMDCARVTVTYASEAPGLAGQGVRVGTHADEGETSDRLRPLADAITSALRQQGFSVSQVYGATIPADQTAIFIGPN